MASDRDDRGSPIASTQDVLLVQEAMRHLGLYAGPVDGIANAATMIAVRAYKRRHAMTVDNSLDAELVRHVRETV